jgi:hypothetical protein
MRAADSKTSERTVAARLLLDHAQRAEEHAQQKRAFELTELRLAELERESSAWAEPELR